MRRFIFLRTALLVFEFPRSSRLINHAIIGWTGSGAWNIRSGLALKRLRLEAASTTPPAPLESRFANAFLEYACLQMSSFSGSPASSTYTSPDGYEGLPGSFYVDRTIPRSHPNTTGQLARNDSTGSADAISPTKQTEKIRLRKACDSCSVRKVKVRCQ